MVALIIVFLAIGFFSPRLCAALLLLTDWYKGLSDYWFWLVLGFGLVPYSTLWFLIVWNVFGGQWGFFQSLFMFIAIGIDLHEKFV